MASDLLGQKLTTALSYCFDTTFRYQFALSPVARTIPDFVHREIGGRHLYACPDLPVCELHAPSGDVIGLLLGYAVDENGALLWDQVTLDLSPDPASDIAAFLATLAGRHLAIIHVPGSPPVSRIYVDTASSLAAVYDPTSGIVASSLLLCLDRDVVPDAHFGLPDTVYACRELAPLLPPQRPDLSQGGFNFGHTPDQHVRRILPNHYLDLNDLMLCRQWPRHAVTFDLSPADIIVDRLKVIMRAMLADLEGYFSISGGRDSRILLACCAFPPNPSIRLHSYATNWMTTMDVKVARVMAEVVGQELLVQIPAAGPKGTYFPRRKRTARYVQRFALSTGFMGTGDRWWQRGYAKRLDSGAIWLRGNFLEILTARFWPMTPLHRRDALIHAMRRAGVGFGPAEEADGKLQMIEDWLASYPAPVEANLHDYSYQELALGSSQPVFYGLNEQFYIGPAADRIVFDTAMRVPPGPRKEGVLYAEILKRSNAALLGVPLATEVASQAKQAKVDAEVLLDEQIAAYRAEHDLD